MSTEPQENQAFEVESTQPTTAVEGTPADEPVAAADGNDVELKKTSTTEPIEDDTSNDASSSVVVHVGPYLFTVFMIMSFALVVVGTPEPWFSRRYEAETTIVGIWTSKTNDKSVTPAVKASQSVRDIACAGLRHRFYAIEVFSILSIAAAFTAVAVGLAASASVRRGQSPSSGLLGAAKGSAAATFVFTLLAWAMGVALYYRADLCGPNTESFNDRKFEIDTGVGLFITAWGLALIALVAAVANPAVPSIVPSTVLVRTLLLVMAVVQVIAFIFSVIGTPTNWFFKWDATGVTLNKVTVWTSRTYDNGVRTAMVDLKDVNCGDFAKIAKFGQSFAIISIATTFIGAVVAKLAATGSASVGAALGAALLALFSTTCTFAAGLTLYFRQFCSTGSLAVMKYHVTGGLVLFGCAMSLIGLLLVVLVVVLVAQTVSDPHAQGYGAKSTVFLLFGLLLCIVFQCISADTPMFTRDTDFANWERLTFWTQRVNKAGVVSDVAFGCRGEQQRLVGAGALNIISVVVNAVAFALVVAQLVSKASLRKTVTIVASLGSLLLLTSFGLVSDTYARSHCGKVSYEERGFNIDYGFALLFVGWAVALVGIVSNFLVPSRAETQQ
ncbi:amastin, putative [Bodo saltans]|uniref:Amastin, putative n=1 Tax=Bodo saltans TaxID=75058 RepID=A0A0S4JNV2_BODSA|nr:amastin, putative [Bodo saltans]|eukprot:CUG90956.1 amastin, putative [Bodo saltans]